MILSVTLGAQRETPEQTIRSLVQAILVEGVNDSDRKVLVGLFGPIEIPFVVHRIHDSWRVEAEPYFSLMLQ